jgi:hypothetical protein
VAESLNATAIIATHLSRFAEDFIIWSTKEFGFAEIDDAFCTGSSLMPQKKNPDPMEAIEGKANEAISSCTNALSIARGLVTGYHKDFQEMKRPLWKSMDDARFSVVVMAKALRTLIVKKKRMLELVLKNNVTAMDLAEHLAQNTSLSFRESHFLVGSLVREVMNRGKGLAARIRNAAGVAMGFLQSLALLWRFRPDLVFGSGGTRALPSSAPPPSSGGRSCSRSRIRFRGSRTVCWHGTPDGSTLGSRRRPRSGTGSRTSAS